LLISDDARQRKLDEETTAALVRERDRDRYWSALFAPRPNRPGLLALYAFNAELDHIPALVSEPMAGQIRLQWWRDAVDFATPGARTGNPVADALSAAIIQYNLPKDRLIGMVDARVPAMFDDPPADEKALKASLRETEGAVFELAAAILGERSATAKEAAAYAGIAYGLTAMFIKLPFLASRQKVFLPSSYLENRGIDLAAIHRGETSESFGAALADLRGVASRALQQFRAKAVDLDPAAWPAFLPLTLVKPYLRAMAAPDFDPLHTAVAISPLRRFWRIWRAARRGRL
jgi:phytoene synthase